MAYTEIKEINGKKYYYRVRSVREGKKFKKKRIYLGKEPLKEELSLKEEKADKKLNIGKKSKDFNFGFFSSSGFCAKSVRRIISGINSTNSVR